MPCLAFVKESGIIIGKELCPFNVWLCVEIVMVDSFSSSPVNATMSALREIKVANFRFLLPLSIAVPLAKSMTLLHDIAPFDSFERNCV
jgi:hypothetical protein